MSTAADAGVRLPTQLPVEWQDWITQAVVQGTAGDEIVTRMQEAGFDPVFARSAVIVIASMTSRVQQESPEALTGGHVCSAPRLQAGNRIRAADRTVGIGFALRNPNVALLTNLLSADECERLIHWSAGKLKRSEVVDRASGGLQVSHVRTSAGTHFDRGENAVVQRLEQRIAALTGVPVEHGEPLQILHYQVGGEYQPHHDFFDPRDAGSPAHLACGGQRVGSIVIYLNDVPEGGATDFPSLELSVKPQQGCAIYFEYCNEAGELDSRCLHGGAPVIRGEKWVATKWLRQGAYVR